MLPGCTSLQRYIHTQTDNSLKDNTFTYSDGGSSIYYSFENTPGKEADKFIFFYGGSGCTSWKTVMPDYAKGLPKQSKIFVLNKRFVGSNDLGMIGCSQAFHTYNNPKQWVSDYREFISFQLKKSHKKLKAVVLVGVSEGGNVALAVARKLPAITHIMIIGSGGYTMRESLKVLKKKGDIPFLVNIDKGLQDIKKYPYRLDKMWFGNPYRWWSDILDYNPMQNYLRLNIPILLAIGEKDSSTPVESVRYLEAEFKKAGKINLYVNVYPNANHRLEAGNKNYRYEFFSKLGKMIKQ